MARYKVAGLVVMAAFYVAAASADVVIETVTVGNPGNVGELSGTGGPNPDRVCGAVDYAYSMGKYEVTAGQYTEFLNAVAASDPYELYNGHMWGNEYGCKIQRLGEAGGYAYAVESDWANRPVNYVSWADAARFANWMHNGQPVGPQGLSTTEHGSYFLNGAMSDAEVLAVVREADAIWVIPSEDEWYKAAYHKNDGVTGNYYDYPTSSDDVPSNELVDPDPGNNATYNNSNWTIGAPYYRTEVGAHENSYSPYGTYDQGGNVWEYNEAVIGSERGLRGGAFSYISGSMHANIRGNAPLGERYYAGFRLAMIPEPGALAILAIMVGLRVLRQR